MSKINEIKKRIVGVKKTKKITQALNMVAASKFRKAHIGLLDARPFSDTLYSLINDLNERIITKDSVFFKNSGTKIGIIVVAGDRGLCGSFNNNVYKEVQLLIEKTNLPVELITVGTKACQYFLNKEFHLIEKYYDFFDDLDINSSRNVSRLVLENYLNQKWSEVHVVYNNFKSALTQIPQAQKILPIDSIAEFSKDKDSISSEKIHSDYIYEPTQEIIINSLLTKHIDFQLYRVFLESITSEQGARMTAMETATDNAEEMINNYTLKYNRIRQAVITTEIAEIVGGAEALS